MPDLKEEIDFLEGHNARGSLRATLKTAVKVNWRKRRLERMERDLADSEQLMQSTLLAWILYVSLHFITKPVVKDSSLGRDRRVSTTGKTIDPEVLTAAWNRMDEQ